MAWHVHAGRRHSPHNCYNRFTGTSFLLAGAPRMTASGWWKGWGEAVLPWLLLAGLFGLTGLVVVEAIPALFLSRGNVTERVEGTGYPRVLVDAYGERTVLVAPPRRIVSVMLAADEMLLDLVPRQRVAAVTIYATMNGVSNCVAQARGLPQISSLDAERVLALQPDLVLAARFSDRATVQQLRSCGVPVFRFGRYDSLADIRANVLLLGEVLDARARAQEIVAGMEATLAQARARAARAKQRPRVLYYNGGWTAGAGTLFDELLTVAGGQNVASAAGLVGHTTISPELVLALDPELILLPETHDFPGAPAFDPRRRILDDPLWQPVTAVRQGRLRLISAQWLGSISHHVVKAALDLSEVLHGGTP